MVGVCTCVFPAAPLSTKIDGDFSFGLVALHTQFSKYVHFARISGPAFAALLVSTALLPGCSLQSTCWSSEVGVSSAIYLSNKISKIVLVHVLA